RITKLEVRGRSSELGMPADRLALSEARATAVIAELVRRGVARERLGASAFGSQLAAGADALRPTNDDIVAFPVRALRCKDRTLAEPARGVTAHVGALADVLALARLGKASEAVALAHDWVRRDSRDPLAWATLGEALTFESRSTEAVRAITSIADVDRSG